MRLPPRLAGVLIDRSRVLGLIALVVLATPMTSRLGAAEDGETIDVVGISKLDVPGALKRVQPKSRILLYEFEAASGEGDDRQTARVTMMADAGDVRANIERWNSQFRGGDPKANKVEQLKVGDWTLHLVDVGGTYAERAGGGPFAGGKVVQREDYAMLGGILVHPSGRTFFVKLVGPRAVVDENRQRVVTMLKGIH